MRKMKIFACALALLSGVPGVSGDELRGKSVYIPKDLAKEDIHASSSKWSTRRMAATENVVLFWAPGFGDNLAVAPPLEGHDMTVDMSNLLSRLENFYTFFRDSLEFTRPGSKAERYKMMAMLDYSLEGTAYGGDYDGEIGALWIAPNRIKDAKLNCIAHELGHSFQLQISADGEGVGWGGCGFYEMASQWMLWQVNPDWPTDENYHLQAYQKATNKAFLHIENIYRSPYVLEVWSEKYGKPYIAELFRQGQVGEDPAMTHMRLQKLSQEQFCDEMFEAQRRQVNWDMPRVRSNMRPYTDGWQTTLVSAGGTWLRPDSTSCPENYGFNAIGLEVPEKGKTVKVDFRGEAGIKGFHTPDPAEAGWRYGFVAVDEDGNSIYSPVKSARKGSVSFTAPADRSLSRLWLVVMGAPRRHVRNIDGPDNPGDPQWPYRIRLHGTELKN